MPDRSKPRFFYGYIVVAAGLIASILIIGPFVSFSVFFKPLSSELGWMRATTSVATSIAALVMGFAAIVAGRITDKYGPRVVLIAGGLFMGLGNVLMSQVNAIWQLYLSYGVLVGIAMGAADVPIGATIARWFVKKRGMMIGITKVGAGIGIMVAPLLANWLISGYGWRNAYLVIGILALVGIIAVALLFKRDPSQIGELPDGASEVEVTDLNSSPRQFSVREAMATKQFWVFCAVWSIHIFCIQVVMLHIVPHVTDLGISATVAASVLSVTGAFSIAGRLGLTSLSDILGARASYVISFSLMAISFVLIQFAAEAWMFYLFAAVYGVAHGANFALLSPMVAELFGLQTLGSMLGTILLVGTFGGLISPVLAGRVFDTAGTYQPVFITDLVASVIAILLMLFLKPTGKEVSGRTS